MSKFRYLLVGAGAALALGGAGVLANVGAISLTTSDSHGDEVASAARTCPHGPNGVHGQCVSAIASSKSEQDTDSAKSTDTCKAADANEDSSEKTGSKSENAAEKAANTSKDQSEKAQVKACEAARDASNP